MRYVNYIIKNFFRNKKSINLFETKNIAKKVFYESVLRKNHLSWQISEGATRGVL